MRRGDMVMHQMHGQGEVVSASSSGAFVVVKYPATNGFYYRTHATCNLTLA